MASACAAPGDCIRYTDCSLGMTCAFGKCVAYATPAQDGDVGADSALSTSNDASQDATAMAAEASTASDGASVVADATKGDAPTE